MASTVTVAVTTILIWLIETLGKTKVPSAIVISISTLLTFVVSYLFPPSDADKVVSS
jgi:hypothetical protein